MDGHPVQAGLLMQPYFLSEHSTLPCIFAEYIRILLNISYLFVIFFDLATAFGIYEGREADCCREALTVYGNCFCRKLV